MSINPSKKLINRICYYKQNHYSFTPNNFPNMTNTPKLPTIEITINKEKIPCLFDSGASANFISRELVPVLSKYSNVIIKNVSKYASTANGKAITIRKEVTAYIHIRKFSWKLTFLVVSNLSVPIIIGSTSMKQMRIILDFYNSEIKFQFDKYVVVEFEQINNLKNLNLNFIAEKPLFLKDDHKLKLNKLLENYQDILTNKIGHVKRYKYAIQLKDQIPVRKNPFPLNPLKAEEMDKHIKQLLEDGIIERCISPYAAPAFLIDKKDGSKRLCVDYRHLNQHVVFDSFPTPRMEEMFQNLHNSKIFTIIDLKSAFYQIELCEQSKPLTAFVVPHGQFQFKFVPFGLAISCQALNRIICDVFGDLRYKYVLPYFDDILIHSNSFEEHLIHIEEVLKRLRFAGFTANPTKSKFAMSSLKFLGFIISEDGVQVDPEKTAAIRNLPLPKTLKQLRSFIGMVSFFRKHIPNLAKIIAPLQNLKRKGIKFHMSNTEIQAFENVKTALISPQVLKFPNFNKQFIVRTDASDVAMGAVLLQEHKNVLHPVAYASKKFTETQLRYATTYEKEALALIWALEKFREYLLGKRFILQTDNAALTFLYNHPKQMGKIGRWVLKLSEYNFELQHINGTLNTIADALSRLYNEEYTEESINNLTEIPASFISIARHQKEDPFCRGIVQNVKIGQDEDNFDIKDGILRKRVGKNKLPRVFIPEKIRNMIIYYFHDVDISAHGGIMKTYRNIAKRFWWPNIYTDVLNYVRSCKICQQHKPSNLQPGAPMNSIIPDDIWSHVYIDHIGPLALSRNKKRHCLVIIDGYSKWLEIVPVARPTAELTIKALEKIWTRYGPPTYLISDNARCFIGKLMRQSVLRWGIKHVKTAPYQPSSNLAERAIKNINAGISTVLRQYSKKHNNWDMYVDGVCYAYNTSFHNSINTTPAAIFLKRELPNPIDLQWNLKNLVSPDKIPTQDEIETALEKAYIHRKKYYDKKRPPRHKFSVGQLVLQKLMAPNKDPTMTPKFLPKWSNPKRIIRFTSPVSCVVREDGTRKTNKIHVDLLRPYHSRI